MLFIQFSIIAKEFETEKLIYYTVTPVKNRVFGRGVGGASILGGFNPRRFQSLGAGIWGGFGR